MLCFVNSMIHRIFKTFNFLIFRNWEFEQKLYLFWSCTTKSVRKITRSCKNWIFYMYYRLILHLKLHLFIWSLVSKWSMYVYLSKWRRCFFWEKLCCYWWVWPEKSCYVLKNNVPEWRHILNLITRSRNLGNFELEVWKARGIFS